jgi:tetratricopeptide (TPR) repeat protein
MSYTRAYSFCTSSYGRPLGFLQAGNLALAKQHYRRALQKCPQYFSPRIYLQLGDCFMSSGDAVVTADMLAACIAATPTSSVSSPAAGPAQQLTSSATSRAHCLLSAVGTAVDWLVPGRCASVWLKLALAYARLGDVRSAELALSEANLCDPEHPAVWGHLALLALQQVGRVQYCCAEWVKLPNMGATSCCPGCSSPSEDGLMVRLSFLPSATRRTSILCCNGVTQHC